MPLATGQTLKDRYRIVKLLGQGGFGAVYRAWDTSLNAPCALKENSETSAAAQKQFITEARLLANLRHPNLPRVTDHFIIPSQGQYLVMDFIEGDDLGTLLERNAAPLPEAQVLAWIGQVCEALEYLHTQNPSVIHRDIKPANIKITPRGQAMLVDFGIAKVYDPKLKTTLGARAVTPGYSPQEQYGLGTTDPRTDIYALGATLYTLLTNQEPVESIQRTIGIPLAPPRKLNPSLSLKVEKTILKAMEPVPGARFQSMAEFHQALPLVIAPPYQPAKPKISPAQTPPPQTEAAAPGGTQVIYPANQPGQTSATFAQPNQPMTPQIQEVAMVAVTGFTPETAPMTAPSTTGLTMKPARPFPTRAFLRVLAFLGGLVMVAIFGWLVAGVVIPKIEASRQAASQTSLARAVFPTPRPSDTATMTLFPTMTSVPSITPSPTLEIPVSEGTPVPPSMELINARNVSQLTKLAEMEIPSLLPFFTWTPDGSGFIVTTKTGLMILDFKTFTERYSLTTASPVICLALSPVGNTLVAGTADGRAYVWREIFRLNSNSQPTYTFTIANQELEIKNNRCNTVFSPDGDTIFTGIANDSKIQSWQTETGKLLSRINLPGTVTTITSSTPRNLIAVGTNQGKVFLITIGQPNKPEELGFQVGEPINNITFSRNGLYLAAGYGRKLLNWYVYEARETSPKRISSIISISNIDYSSDNAIFAAGIDFGSIIFYEAISLEPLVTLYISTNPDDLDVPIGKLAFSPDGRYLAAITNHGTLMLWGILE